MAKTLKSSDLVQVRKQLETIEAFNALDTTDLKGLQITLIHNSAGAGRPLPPTQVWIPNDHASFDDVVAVAVAESSANADAATASLTTLGFAQMAPAKKVK